jgi:hypothetical protein
MLSAIIQKVTGVTLLEFLTPRLFDPLGIEGPIWESNPEGINVGGWGLSVRTGDISRFGQLYLDKGMWNGEQLIPEAWVEEATSFQTSNGSNPESDWEQGYGFQFWRCRHHMYRGDGAFGQFCIVMPEQDAVLAITSGTGDMQGVLNLVWEHLLPAIGDEALPADEEGLDQLNRKLEQLAIHPAQGEETSTTASSVSGRRFILEPNGMGMQSVTFDFDQVPHVIKIVSQAGEPSFKVGYQQMEMGRLKGSQWISEKIAASGAWITPETYGVKLVYYETPYMVDFEFDFSGNSVTWDTRLNVSFGDTELEQFRGSAR